MDGAVIDVRVFSREGVEKDDRANSIEASDLDAVKKDLNDQQRIVEDDIYNRIEKLLLNKMAKVGRQTKKISRDDLEKLNRDQWFGFKLQNKKNNSELESYYKRLQLLEEEYQGKLKAAKNRYRTLGETWAWFSQKVIHDSWKKKYCHIET